jgi:hypothetical protein
MKNYFLFSLIFFIVSCGPSTEEKAAIEKAKMDSVIKATEEATKHKIESISLIEDSVKLAVSYKEILENRLLSKKGDLEVAKDKMNKIKEFHFGRTSSEKELQIKNQVAVIDGYEKEIEKLNDSIFKISKKIEDLKEKLIKLK